MKKVLLCFALLTAIGISQELTWKRFFPGVAGSDYMNVVVDSKNNVIVTVTDTVIRSWVIKFSPAGESLWSREVHLPMDPGYPGLPVATDPDDNIIVGRMAGGTWTVMKLTSSGDSLWTWVTEVGAYLTDIATNSNGYILITGYRSGTYESMWFTFQLTPDGQTDWMRTFTSEWGPDKAGGVCADPFNNVIVGGTRGIPGRNRQWFPQFIKYSKNGDTLAEVIYNPGPAACLFGMAPATDRWGNIILAGWGKIYWPEDDWYGAFLLKYDPQGNPLWQRFIDDTASDRCLIFYQCVTDSSGNIYCSGRGWWPPSYPHVVHLMRFSPSGNAEPPFLYVLSERAQGTNMPPTVWLAIDHQGDIIVATKVGTGVPANDTGYVLKFTNWPVGITEDQERRKAAGYHLPTVINAGTPIQLDFPQGTRIEVYDKTGRLLQKTSNGQNLSLPSVGVYFLRVISSGEKERRKLVVIK